MNRTEAADFREQLFVALLGAPSPMSTDEVAAGAPWQVHSVRSRCASTHPDGQITPWNVVECHVDWHVIERPRSGHDIYPHLRRLEQDGRIARRTVAGDRKVYWVALDAPAESPPAVNDLDALGVSS
ncbi:MULTISPECIES: hypothetical protein [Mycobacterium]|uniref:Transcription regulator PadR N-terminal domain-containing protein n=4 Tax=Mycobacterium TaxID=1763 RepID=A0AAW5RZ48_MYCBC|nr:MULTISPECIES: hypothetical protein [Mycobacterium]MBZ4631305.1 hypothetical protein [Mycobacterium avium subsp. hominissuis]MCV6987741.1 hypothetical protein [Mycobacterium bouchedurhonense]MCV6996932.1 hypothetical protein [Mycobacterium timonense]ORA43015.1 hypothetical protein BST19_23665 [Mycobacterium bouchedurhonense]ORB77036.1 hypothetical protein BST46_26775 [Mycobacterium timonense]